MPCLMQDAMKRLTLDSFLPAGGFGFELNALNFKPCQVSAALGLIMQLALTLLACQHVWISMASEST